MLGKKCYRIEKNLCKFVVVKKFAITRMIYSNNEVRTILETNYFWNLVLEASTISIFKMPMGSNQLGCRNLQEQVRKSPISKIVDLLLFIKIILFLDH